MVNKNQEMQFPEPPNNDLKPESIEGVLSYYNEYFVPVFAYATAVSGILSEQMLNELRNCLDHMSKANRGLKAEENLKKAKNHIDRSCLDCAKIAWVELYNEANELYSSYKPKQYMLVDSGRLWQDVSQLHTQLRRDSLTARTKEPESINDDVGEAISFYYKANKTAELLTKTITDKVSDLHYHIDLYNKKVLSKDIKMVICSAIIGALLSLALCNFSAIKSWLQQTQVNTAAINQPTGHQ